MSNDEIKRLENKIIKKFEELMSTKDSTHLGLMTREEGMYKRIRSEVSELLALIIQRELVQEVYEKDYEDKTKEAS